MKEAQDHRGVGVGERYPPVPEPLPATGAGVEVGVVDDHTHLDGLPDALGGSALRVVHMQQRDRTGSGLVQRGRDLVCGECCPRIAEHVVSGHLQPEIGDDPGGDLVVEGRP